MIRHRAVFFVIFVAALLVGCSKENPPSASQPPASQAPAPVAAAPATPAASAPAAAPAVTGALKTADTNIAGVVADVTECSRKDGVLSIKVRFRNIGSEKKALRLINGRDYEKFYVTAGSKKYFILKDSEGTYLTPEASSFGDLSPDLEPGGQYTWWAKYPAPPPDVKAITLYTSVAAPFEDVPVSD